MKPTVKNMLLLALSPIGKTLYIYGGGWNEADTSAGEEAKTIGTSPLWQSFYSLNTRGYNYKNFDYKKKPNLIHFGLDCSGYVGWVLYNLFESKNGKNGYVYKSNTIAKVLAEKGLGIFTAARDIASYLPGDILSGDKTCHTFIALSQCSDKSLILLHSSPPSPMVSSTPTPEGCPSQADALAEGFMKKAYPKHFALHPDIKRPVSYLTDYNLFRFYPHILKDPDDYNAKTAQEILTDLFNTISKASET
ncbi:MAG: hypothetical protein LUC92_10110 [Clostridiales bacterium]|nr:hypothetical protein [Clostridiales bacterium]